MLDRLIQQATDLLYEEASCLDQRRWSDWVELFTEDAEYWIPAWDSEHVLTADPASEISLIYYDSRAGIEDRVFRIQTGLAGSATPLPRTCHLIANVRVASIENDKIRLASNWRTDSFYHQKKQVQSFSGFYEHTIRREPGDRLRIERKKVIVINDVIPSVLDVYSV